MDGIRPSVSQFLKSVGRFCGGRAVGVLLSGMGKDGAAELAQMRKSGALTFAQDEESCVVYGMPGEAVRLGGVDHIMSPEQIGQSLSRLAASGRGEQP